MNELPDEAIATLVEQAATIASPFSAVLVEPKGWVISQAGEAETAIGGRDAAYSLYAYSIWENPSEDDNHIAWTRGFIDTMESYITPGISPNFTSDKDKVKGTSSGGMASTSGSSRWRTSTTQRTCSA